MEGLGQEPVDNGSKAGVEVSQEIASDESPSGTWRATDSGLMATARPMQLRRAQHVAKATNTANMVRKPPKSPGLR